MKTKKICPICGKEFEATANAKKYCSKWCSNKAVRHESARRCKCAWCGNIFLSPRRKTYCSTECRMFANGRTTLPKPKKKSKKPKLTLARVASLAKEAGMSYGAYVQKNNL